MKRLGLMTFVIGMCFAGFAGSNTASALTCQQKCASQYAQCLASGQSYGVCQNDRAECLFDCSGG
jgi:hypothetical protein